MTETVLSRTNTRRADENACWKCKGRWRIPATMTAIQYNIDDFVFIIAIAYKIVHGRTEQADGTETRKRRWRRDRNYNNL